MNTTTTRERTEPRDPPNDLQVAASWAAERVHCVDHARCSATEHGAHGGVEAVATHKHSSLLVRRLVARARARAGAIASRATATHATRSSIEPAAVCIESESRHKDKPKSHKLADDLLICNSSVLLVA